jgi:hypothetical protein
MSHAVKYQVDVNADFPLAHRLDLPEHERAISAESLKLLDEGLADARAGRIVRMPLSAFLTDDDE